MLMSDLAVRDLEGRRESLFDSVRRMLISVFGRSSDHHLPAAVARRQAQPLRSMPGARHAKAPVRPVLRAVNESPTASPGDKRWARHPQLRAHQTNTATIDYRNRSARLDAERAVLLARGGRLAEALEAFTSAASDATIDLGDLPGFWDLPRNGMMTAVRAYERADRLRDAAALEARIRHLLRPRVLKPVRGRERPDRLTASGD